MTQPLTPERIAELREAARQLVWPVVHSDVLSALLDAAEENVRLRRDHHVMCEEARQLQAERDALRAEVERIREAARPHLIGLWYDSADPDGEPHGYQCIHCAEIHDEHYPTEAEIPHKPDCALWRKRS